MGSPRAKRRDVRTLEPLKDGTGPEAVAGCRFYERKLDVPSGTVFYLACGKCDGCRHYRHEKAVWKSLAEAQSAAAVVSLCLTYEDRIGADGLPVVPDAARRLDYRDVVKLMKRLRRAGYIVRKVHCGEYGKRTGRAHWHLLLYFQWDQQHLELWFQDQANGTDMAFPVLASAWRGFCPPLVTNDKALPKSEFLALLDDPERLYAPSVGPKVLRRYRQNWKYWPHGKVECQLAGAPGVGSAKGLSKSVRYTVKYMSKDPWKDTEYRLWAFDELPEWVRQSTAFGPWDRDDKGRIKWVRGNPYRDALEEQLRADFPGHKDDVPMDRRPMKLVHGLTAKSGLGHDYFRALGWYYAGLSGVEPEQHARRVFKLGPSYRRKHVQDVAAAEKFGKPSPAVVRLNQFYMDDRAVRSMAEGFNERRALLGLPVSQGPNGLWDVLETKARKVSDVASGPVGSAMWARSNRAERKALEKVWADIPNETLAGFVPRRLIEQLVASSKEPGWAEKRRVARAWAKDGKPKHSFRVGSDARLVLTDQRRLFYEKWLDPKKHWWRREVLTAEQLDHALAGALLPEKARAVRIEKEGKGDQRLLASFDPRTVLRRIVKALGDDSREKVVNGRVPAIGSRSASDVPF